MGGRFLYNISAFLYDATAAFEEPEKTCADLQGILLRYGIQPPGLLGDLGSGTGLMAILLAQQGWRVVGIELSSAMIAVAQQKTAQLPLEIQSHLTWTPGDITTFTIDPDRLLDGAVCLCNTINHLVEWVQVQHFTKAAFQALRPGGVLILDSDTRFTFQDFFNHGPVVVWDDGTHQMTRTCQFDEKTGRANHVASLRRYDAAGLLQPVGEEAMALQYHSETELLQAFTLAGFQVESADPYNPNPQLYGNDLERFIPKILWTLRKPQPTP
jgi:SAM-dependent methyltransferase